MIPLHASAPVEALKIEPPIAPPCCELCGSDRATFFDIQGPTGVLRIIGCECREGKLPFVFHPHLRRSFSVAMP